MTEREISSVAKGWFLPLICQVVNHGRVNGMGVEKVRKDDTARTFANLLN